MYKCVHGFVPKLLCDMTVMASHVNVRNTRNTDSLNVYIPNQILNATKNLLIMQVVRSGMTYLIIYRMHHHWKHLNMPIRNLILNTGTLTERFERFYIIFMCMIYFFFICHIICIECIVCNYT